MEFVFLTLFPEIIEPVANASLMGRARRKAVLGIRSVQIRDFATDKHLTVDDSPFGGGVGMLLRADILHAAWSHVEGDRPADRPEFRTRTILMSPQGRVLDGEVARELATYDRLVFVCGHYEGVDERFIETCVDEEISIGDYVLTGGELPALVVADVVSRFVPGVVGKEDSVLEDSHENFLLKYPQYTRPREFMGRPVPEVLLSGHHGQIEQWRQAEREKRTRERRPDLWRKFLEKMGRKS